MGLYIVRMYGSDVAVAADSFETAIKAACYHVMQENPPERGEEGDHEAWARSLITQVISVDAEVVLIADRKSWARFTDDGIGDWYPLAGDADGKEGA